jgi:S1-C subfamily serine protease
MLKSSVFLILNQPSESGMSTSSSSEAGVSIDGNRYGGVGVCVGAREAVTAAHNLEGFDIHDPVQVFFPRSKQKLQLLVMDKDTKLDYAVLAAATESTHFSTHLPLYRGSSVSLVGQQLAMCAFQLGVHEELPEWSPSSLGVMPATGVKLSKQEHHLFYTSDTWPGDSGGALVMYNGELVGLHVCGVNALKERYERMRSVEARLTAVEESLESAARSVASGCVALLASVFANKIDV